MTELFVMLIEDRHCDVQVALFEDKDEAIEAARDAARLGAGGYGVRERTDIAGWEFAAFYGEGSECTRVMKVKVKEVDGDGE